MLRKIRITLAAVMMVMVTLLFLDVSGALHHWLGWTAKIQFLPAFLALNVVVVVALILLTFIFGRIYCSVICPLGIFQDIVSWIHGRFKKGRFTSSPEKSWLRYGVLALFVGAMVAGVSVIVSLLAPYSSYGRIVTNLFQPIYLWGNNLFTGVAEHYNGYASYSVDVWLKSLPMLIVAVTFVVIVVLAWRGGRTYCNTICPVGTVLSFVSRFSLLKVYIDTDKCKSCGQCTRNCKASCIDFKTHKVDYSRCVVCGDCLTKCKLDALHYGRPTAVATAPADGDKGQPADASRRAMLVGSSILCADMVLGQARKKVDGGLAVIEDKKTIKRATPITPPGSRTARNFYQHCTACQLCVSKCPNGVLRPSSDPEHFMQPELSFEHGVCRPECTICSEVCPTGAIKLITVAEKATIAIGQAVRIKDNCVLLNNNARCGRCYEHCPAKAIDMLPTDPEDFTSPILPVVLKDKCIGCGTCEHLCPAKPKAIYVEGYEAHRKIKPTTPSNNLDDEQQ